MSEVYLIEDHNEALDIWRRRNIRGLDLVHIDAHIDFGFYPVRPIKTILADARSLKELTARLEQNILFLRYEDSLDKQANIANYIYPAIRENIVKDFYWVIPTGTLEFKANINRIKKILSSLGQRQVNSRSKNICPPIKIENGLCSTQLCGRKITVCSLKTLPVIKEPVLLDIDTDFLVVPSLRAADNIYAIGKRRPWINPRSLVEAAKDKIKQFPLVTVAYSVNDGYTPMKYKHLGDEVAYHLAPRKFYRHLRQRQRAADYFNSFLSSGRKADYQRAIRYNPTYAAKDNNYGPLYINTKKYALALKEFRKILRADPKHAGANLGLALLALKENRLKKARACLELAIKPRKNPIKSSSLIRNLKSTRNQARVRLAGIEFSCGNLKRAKRLLNTYLRDNHLNPYAYYILGRIHEKNGSAQEALQAYKSAVALGLDETLDALKRIFNISIANKENGDIFNYILSKLLRFKRGVLSFGKRESKNMQVRRYQRKISAQINSFEKILRSKKGVISER